MNTFDPSIINSVQSISPLQETSGPSSPPSAPIVATAVNNRTLNPTIELTRFNPLSASAEQMLLGTLLGDGGMQWLGTNYGRFSIRHGAKQQEYCESKAAQLADYINTPAKIVPNPGWGDENSVFSTVTSPVFEFLRTLCYRQNLEFPDNPKRLMKFANPAWLARLTWEGIAYWYMDDGTLQGTGKCRVALFNTHKFPQDQVELLAQMLRGRGIEAKAGPVRKGEKTFWIIRLTAASTRLFVQKIAPFVHPTMLYKIDAPERDLPNCVFCGGLVDTRNINWQRPCCRKKECQLKRNRERNQKYTDRNRAKVNARSKSRRDANLEEARAKARADRARRDSDPEYRKKWNEERKAWLKKRKEDPAYKAKVNANKLASYHKRMKEPAFREKRNKQIREQARERRRNKALASKQDQRETASMNGPITDQTPQS